jgi:catechol 2,3-dioxygenase-like lactoylglutathione lyase family enzyme
MLPAGWFPARSGADRNHRTKGGGRTVYWRFEVVPIPITDVDRAKRFYAEQVGFVVDLDTWIGEGVRLVQLTPPGSACSIHLNTGIAGPAPGSLQGLMLTVSGIDVARAELLERGVEVSPVQHYEGADLVEGRGGGWNSFVFFGDPDGNGWVLQESSPAIDAAV